jgi:NAD(P)-dependent dehydrogenase (short-subunit alcohol dehydrogenase family)
MAPRSLVWLITGCSSGFGLQLAQIAASRGDLVLAASRNPDKAQELAGQKNIKLVRLDHNEELPKIKEAINDIISVYGTIDIVVNNAAYVQTGTIEEASPEETLRQFQANFFGPLNLYRAVLPHLRTKGRGTLVTIGSMAAWYPMNSCNLYNASKAALRWATIGLAEEVKGFGIQHCLVEPGFFRTGLLKPDANIAGTPTSTRLPEYDEINKATDENLRRFNGKQLGNPVKGAEIIYEVVTSTGVAHDKALPEFLPLGSDASTEISKAAHKTLDAIEEWRAVSALSDFPESK